MDPVSTKSTTQYTAVSSQEQVTHNARSSRWSVGSVVKSVACIAGAAVVGYLVYQGLFQARALTPSSGSQEGELLEESAGVISQELVRVASLGSSVLASSQKVVQAGFVGFFANAIGQEVAVADIPESAVPDDRFWVKPDAQGFERWWLDRSIEQRVKEGCYISDPSQPVAVSMIGHDSSFAGFFLLPQNLNYYASLVASVKNICFFKYNKPEDVCTSVHQVAEESGMSVPLLNVEAHGSEYSLLLAEGSASDLFTSTRLPENCLEPLSSDATIALRACSVGGTAGKGLDIATYFSNMKPTATVIAPIKQLIRSIFTSPKEIQHLTGDINKQFQADNVRDTTLTLDPSHKDSLCPDNDISFLSMCTHNQQPIFRHHSVSYDHAHKPSIAWEFFSGKGKGWNIVSSEVIESLRRKKVSSLLLSMMSTDGLTLDRLNTFIPG